MLETVFGTNDTALNITSAICSGAALAATGVDISTAGVDKIAGLSAFTTQISYGVDSGWLVICGAMVFIMHGGFAMVSPINRSAHIIALL